MDNIKMNDLNFNSENISDSKKIRSAINKLLVNYLDKIPVYNLNSKDFKHSLVKLLLKDIETKEDKLIITLSN